MPSLTSMRRPLVWFAVLAVPVVSGRSAPGPVLADSAAAVVRQVTPAEFAAEVESRLVVNVHTPDEGSIRGTGVMIPFDQVRLRAAELPKDRATPLAIYCMSGRMSAIAGETLTGLRYTDVANSVAGWRRDRGDQANRAQHHRQHAPVAGLEGLAAPTLLTFRPAAFVKGSSVRAPSSISGWAAGYRG